MGTLTRISRSMPFCAGSAGASKRLLPALLPGLYSVRRHHSQASSRIETRRGIYQSLLPFNGPSKSLLSCLLFLTNRILTFLPHFYGGRLSLLWPFLACSLGVSAIAHHIQDGKPPEDDRPFDCAQALQAYMARAVHAVVGLVLAGMIGLRTHAAHGQWSEGQ
jgi:hypothetical protein